MSEPLRNYLKAVEEALRAGNATEHTHRPALKALLEGLRAHVAATNEPARVECGAPDFAVAMLTPAGPLTIGHVETKDTGRSLDEAERSGQLRRYLHSLPNLVLTDYLEFRWYVEGERRAVARLGQAGPDGRIRRDAAGIAAAEALLGGFLAHTPEPVTTPRALAERMARLTHIIRDTIVIAFERDKASAMLRDLRAAFARTLIPELDQPEKTAEFADMYAQTIAYGLFAARCNHGPAGPFRRLGAAAEIPKTNPFLRKLFDTLTGTQLDDEPYCGFVDDLAALLSNTHIEEVLAEFGARARREDPVVHFYETFLATYDRKLRKARGVYYTPEPVVSYIVRSVDHLLRTRFGLPQGLRDEATVRFTREVKGDDGKTVQVEEEAPRVLVLDPACGTGTFLYAVVDHIREQFIREDNAGKWSGYVRNHLLPRLFGFELLMAPYAVAHLKLGMQLAAQDLPREERARWACNFTGQERLGIYLTNTLEETERVVQQEFHFVERIIAEEGNAAARVKHDLPIMVILGNPPYANFGRMNRGQWITRLMADWRPRGERKWNPDDFMKFLRWAQWRIARTGAGILAFITNHAYITGVTHRAMREAMLNEFSEIYILDLHGSVKKGEACPDGSKDENVFDIQPGVAIGIFVREPGRAGPARVYHADLWGLREHKYRELLRRDITCSGWRELKRVGRSSCLGRPFLFAPKATANLDEYCKGWSVRDAFVVSGCGAKTERDRVSIHLTREGIEKAVADFRTLDEASLRRAYELGDDSRDWTVPNAKADVLETRNRGLVRPILYRPFDIRWTWYSGHTRGFIGTPGYPVMRHLLMPGNLALLSCRQQAISGFQHVFCARGLTECCAVSLKSREITSVFPLYVYPRQGQIVDENGWVPAANGRLPNLNGDFVAAVSERTGLRFISDGVGDLVRSFGPEDVFHYAYATLHSPEYRSRYAEFLMVDFPRLPLTSSVKLFRALCHLGADLVALHLLEDAYPHASWTRRGRPCPLASPATTYPVPGDNRVEKGHPKYLAPGHPEPGTRNLISQGRVYISKDDAASGTQGQYFDGVPPEVWAFRVGGYQVCHKWLKDRVGRQLSYDDLTHYQRVVAALGETIRLMAKIDSAIESHGGWPIG